SVASAPISRAATPRKGGDLVGLRISTCVHVSNSFSVTAWGSRRFAEPSRNALLTDHVSEQEQIRHGDEQRYENGTAVKHVAEETRHRHPGLLGNALDHEVRSVADVGVRSHQHGGQ